MYNDRKRKEDRMGKRDWAEYLSMWGFAILGAVIFSYMIWHSCMVDIIMGIV
jgi:hypothetical protein